MFNFPTKQVTIRGMQIGWNRKQKMSEAENKSQFKIKFRLRQFKTTKFGLQQINKLIGVKFPS